MLVDEAQLTVNAAVGVAVGVLVAVRVGVGVMVGVRVGVGVRVLVGVGVIVGVNPVVGTAEGTELGVVVGVGGGREGLVQALFSSTSPLQSSSILLHNSSPAAPLKHVVNMFLSHCITVVVQLPKAQFKLVVATVEPTHNPPWQLSSLVHGLPSSQAVPLGLLRSAQFTERL